MAGIIEPTSAPAEEAHAPRTLTTAEINNNKTSGGNVAFHNFNNDFAHVADANERRRLALAEIDKAPFGWYHVRAIIVAGIGFFTDSYDIFTIGLVTSMLGIVYYGGTLPTEYDTAIKVATSAGTVIGQVGFGVLADIVGRKKMYGVELMVIIIATIAQALSSSSPSVSITGLIVFWRIIMGIGIGGDYPLSAIITSEFATTKWRGFMMNAVFANQGFGQLAGGLMLLIVTSGFKGSLETATKAATCSTTEPCLIAVDKMWRTMIGFGAVPGCLALYFRLTIPETPRYTFDVDNDVHKAEGDVDYYKQGKWGEAQVDEAARVAARTEAKKQLEVPKASWSDFFRHYSTWKNAKVLLGTAGSWFFLDVAFYGLGLNNAIILNAIGWSGGADMYHIFYKTSVGNLILVLAGAVPGYWVSAALVDTIGRKPIQLFGFFVLTLLFCVIGFDFWNLSGGALMALYTLAQFFFNAGPNSTTFIVPGECFPTRYRSTSHGLSAASGKLGAIIAQVVFGPLRTIGANSTLAKTDPRWSTPWLNHIMQIFALFMLCGFCTSWLIPETARKTLEELSGEDDLATSAIPVHGHNEEKRVEEGTANGSV
ncbi:phosphate:H+ symporter [Colletotrichum truncatum]|uniref:Phosphate:H+ symporter n=1 Tax=Colletotrichum truncatum TaxID=5467 RepID=A0ACC3Z643_COLTU|nr:phosphate:H+ symporter [Colletotrichum truncatum]KAF6787151.1 phosphate:H+ symporter [Colletotrichum truncatum]